MPAFISSAPSCPGNDFYQLIEYRTIFELKHYAFFIPVKDIYDSCTAFMITPKYVKINGTGLLLLNDVSTSVEKARLSLKPPAQSLGLFIGSSYPHYSASPL